MDWHSTADETAKTMEDEMKVRHSDIVAFEGNEYSVLGILGDQLLLRLIGTNQTRTANVNDVTIVKHWTGKAGNV